MFTFFHQPPLVSHQILRHPTTPRLQSSWRNLLTSHGEKTSLEELERCFEALVGDASIHRAFVVEIFDTLNEKNPIYVYIYISQEVKDH